MQGCDEPRCHVSKGKNIRTGILIQKCALRRNETTTKGLVRRWSSRGQCCIAGPHEAADTLVLDLCSFPFPVIQLRQGYRVNTTRDTLVKRVSGSVGACVDNTTVHCRDSASGQDIPLTIANTSVKVPPLSMLNPKALWLFDIMYRTYTMGS